MDLRALDHEDFDLGLLPVSVANELMGVISALPPDKKGVAMKKILSKRAPISLENNSRSKMMRMMAYLPPDIQKGLLEKRLQLVDSDFYVLKNIGQVKTVRMIQDIDNKAAGTGNISKQKLEHDNHFLMSGIVLLMGVGVNKEDVTFDVITHEVRNGDFEFKINGGKTITPSARVGCEVFDTSNRTDIRKGLWHLDNPKLLEAEQAIEFNIDFAAAPVVNTWMKAILVGSSVTPY